MVGLLGTDGVTRHPESLLAKHARLSTKGSARDVDWRVRTAFSDDTGSIERCGADDRKCAIDQFFSALLAAITGSPDAAQYASAGQSQNGGHSANSPKMLEPVL